MGVRLVVSNGFREGARSGDPLDVCPSCKLGPCLVGIDFKKFGQHQLRVCANPKCLSVTVDENLFPFKLVITEAPSAKA